MGNPQQPNTPPRRQAGAGAPNRNVRPGSFIPLTPAAPSQPPVRTPRSRIVWGWLVFGIGVLWTAGGFIGLATGQRVVWILPVLGIILMRVGWNIRTQRSE